MERKKNQPWLLVLLASMYFTGVIGLYFPASRPLFAILTPFNLLFSWGAIFYFYPKNRLFASISLFVALAGYIIEVAGVHTGVIFGNYAYGETLGWKLFDVPVILSVNWLMLIWATGSVAESFAKNKTLVVIIGSLFMILLDVFIEPVAMNYDFWEWAGDTVPKRNYLAWFVISLIFLAAFKISGLQLKNKIATAIYIYQLIFFIFLYILS
ncbi:carotenoid biosynthesis protein [Cytophagaceae bacterium ABcell3]|nr:carotenoid biosynthesis protein [Cytophagaceae bacterium ABcell3]